MAVIIWSKYSKYSKYYYIKTKYTINTRLLLSLYNKMWSKMPVLELWVYTDMVSSPDTTENIYMLKVAVSWLWFIVL